MDTDKRFGRRQLLALSATALLSPALRLYPSASAALAGRGAWLSAACCLPPLLLYLLFFCRFTARRREGEGLAELIARSLGGKAGRAVPGLLALWLLLYAGFVLRASAERFVVTLFPRSGPGFFVLTLGLAALLTSLRPSRTLVRTARMLLPPLLTVLLLLLLAALRSAQLENLLPLTADDALPVLCGALPVAEVLLFGVCVPAFLLGGTEKRTDDFRALALWLLGMILLLTALCAAVLGCFGAALTQRLSLPFFTLVRNLIFFRSLERMEALVVALWLFPDFLLSALALQAAQRCLRPALALAADRRWPGWAGGAAAIAAGLLIAPGGGQLALWSERIVPAGNLFIALVLLPIIYIVGRKRL